MRKDLTGRRFGKLTVVSFMGVNTRRKTLWNCLCECGGSKTCEGTQLGNRVNSCGCLRYNLKAYNDTRSKTCRRGHDRTDSQNLTKRGRCKLCQVISAKAGNARYKEEHPTYWRKVWKAKQKKAA